MFDVGWTELLVIAVVLIVVVGPKDLPPMLRAFGKMTARARKVAGEFRAQFDEALREAELDDVRQTIADAQKLNPVHSLREAMNPLRQMGNEIKADLQRSTTVDRPATATEAEAISETSASLTEMLPAAPVPAETAPVASAPGPVPVSAPASVMETPVKAKPVRKPRAKAPAKTEAALASPEAVAEKPKRAPARKKAASTVVAETPAAAPKKRTTRKKDNA